MMSIRSKLSKFTDISRMVTGTILISLLLQLQPVDAATIAAPANRPLKFGILPMFSPVTLFERFAPLRDYLSKRLQREILLETASSYDEFKRRTNEQNYDIVLTAPHFASSAEKTGRYHIVAIPTNPLSAYIVVRSNSPITRIDQLRGKTIATPSTSAFISIIGKQYLQNQGLDSKAVNYLEFKSHNAAYQSVLGDESQAALISNNIFNQAVADGQPLRKLSKTQDYPGIVYLTSINLPETMANDIQQILITMSADSEGQQILKKIIHPGYMKPSPGMLQVLRSMAN